MLQVFYGLSLSASGFSLVSVIFQEAERIGKEEQRNLLKHRKLVLLLDLDLTLIHTTNDENINPNMKVSYCTF